MPEIAEQARRRHDLAGGGVVDHRLGQSAQRRLLAEDLREHAGRGEQVDPRAVEVVGHLERDGSDIVAMLVEIAACHLERAVQCRAYRVVEPGLDAEMEEGDGEHRDQDRRGDRDATKQQDQAHVQPRSGRSAPPLHPYAREPAGEHCGQKQQDREIGEHQRRARAGLHAERHAARHDHERAEADREGEHDEGDRHRLAKQDRGDPVRQSAPALNLRRTQLILWRRDVHALPRVTMMSRSRIFLRSVLRFSPSMAAALI